MMEAVRRFLAIVLFAAFVLPLVLPGLAPGQAGEAGLPACCRRAGAHHCGMAMAELPSTTRRALKSPKWQTALEHCPFRPAALLASHTSPLAPRATQARLAAFFSLSFGVAQTESRWRIARDRSRQKRGPPAVVFA